LHWARTTEIARAGRDLVAPEDRRRLKQFRSTEGRTQFLAGRALARYALTRSTGRPAQSHRLLGAPGQKPICARGPPFSLAHSGHFVVCAVSRSGAIGVDVEQPRSGRRTTAIAESYFSPAERAWLSAGPPERFYMLWVLKEAYLKALGVGLAGGLGALQCRIEPPRIEVIASGRCADLALFRTGEVFVGVARLDCPMTSIEIETWTRRIAPSSLRFVAATRASLTRRRTHVARCKVGSAI